MFINLKETKKQTIIADDGSMTGQQIYLKISLENQSQI